jgi:preprotein translocase subunit SecE
VLDKPNGINMNALISYLKHVREEFTHIVWPSRQTAIAHTLVVIFIAASIALLVGLLDYGFSAVVNHIVGGY